MSKKTPAERTWDRTPTRNKLLLRVSSVAPTTTTIPYLAKVVNYVFDYHPIQTM